VSTKGRRTWVAIHRDFFQDIGELLVLDILRYDRMTVEGSAHLKGRGDWWFLSTEGDVQFGRLASFGLREPTLDRPGALMPLGLCRGREDAHSRLETKIREIAEARAGQARVRQARQARQTTNTGRCTAPSATN